MAAIDHDNLYISNIFNNSFDSRIYVLSSQCVEKHNNFNSDFTVKLYNKPSSPKFLKLLNFNGNVLYNLPDSFILDESGQPLVTLTFPDGVYDDLNFEAALANLLTAGSPSGSTYTVVFDLLTKKITITSTGGTFRFRMDLTSNFTNPSNHTLAALGLAGQSPNTPLLPYSNPLIAPHPINLAAYNNTAYQILVSPLDHTSNFGTYGNTYNFLVSPNNLSGQNTQSLTNSSYHQASGVNPSTNLSVLRIQIFDSWGNFIKFQYPVEIIFSWSEYTRSISH